MTHSRPVNAPSSPARPAVSAVRPPPTGRRRRRYINDIDADAVAEARAASGPRRRGHRQGRPGGHQDLFRPRRRSPRRARYPDQQCRQRLHRPEEVTGRMEHLSGGQFDQRLLCVQKRCRICARLAAAPSSTCPRRPATASLRAPMPAPNGRLSASPAPSPWSSARTKFAVTASSRAQSRARASSA